MENSEKEEANKILKRLGSTDGRKHLDQILYLVEGMNSIKLMDYWNTVDKYFKTEKK
jgi:hypothetical protein